MDRSIYTALNSMNILRDNKSVTAQNLANVNVTGFQKDIQINFESVYLDRDKGIDPRVMALQDIGGCDPDPSLRVPSADTVKSPRLDSANLPLTGFTTKYPLPSIARSSGTPVG